MIGASSSPDSSRSCGSWLISLASIERSSAASLAERVGRAGPAVVDLVDRAEDRALRGELEHDVGAVEQQAQVVERRGVERIGHRDAHRAAHVARERQHAVVLGEADRQPLDQALVDVALVDLRADRQAELLGLGAEQLVGGDVPARHEQVAEPAARFALRRARGLELLLGERGRAQQDLADVALTRRARDHAALELDFAHSRLARLLAFDARRSRA